MSKKSIEDTFDIPSIDDLQQAMKFITSPQSEEFEDELMPAISTEELQEALSNAKDMKRSLMVVPDILDKEDAIDNLSDTASKYFEDIMDKAFNSEDKYASELMTAANLLLKTAIDGKTALINAKLKLLDLELKKQRLDQSVKAPEIKQVNGTEVTLADRNSLLRKR